MPKDLFGGTNSNEPFSAEYLRSILHYDPDTGIWTWLQKTSRSSHMPIGSIAGSIYNNGHRVITISKRRYLSSILAWLYMTENGQDLKSIT